MQPLSTRLREGTKAAHVAAERSPLMRVLLRGGMTPGVYRQLLESWLAIYDALERGLAQHQAHPLLAPLYFPELCRVPALRADLQFFADLAKTTEPPLPSTLPVGAQRYAARLTELSAADPVLLLAHAYTRYLGDLSGGQLLAGVVRRALSLTSTEGTAFFEFAQLSDLAAFKAEYRRRLDAVPLTDTDAQRVVEEAVAAFGYNQALTDELTPALQQSLGAARFAELSTPVSR